MVKQSFYSIILTGSLLLTGCSLSGNDVITIKEEKIMSDDYHDKLVKTLYEFIEYTKVFKGDELKSQSEELLIYLDELELNPETEVDYEINSYLKEFVENAEWSARNAITYVDSEEEKYKKESIKYMREVLGDTELIYAVLNKYNLK